MRSVTDSLAHAELPGAPETPVVEPVATPPVPLAVIPPDAEFTAAEPPAADEAAPPFELTVGNNPGARLTAEAPPEPSGSVPEAERNSAPQAACAAAKTTRAKRGDAILLTYIP